jgi:hypothetical protein
LLFILREKLLKYFAYSEIEAYNLRKGALAMNRIMTKKLNKQALVFVVVNTLFVFNLAYDIIMWIV